MKFLVFSPEAFVPFQSLESLSAFSRTAGLRPRRGGCTDSAAYERLHTVLVGIPEVDERSMLITERREEDSYSILIAIAEGIAYTLSCNSLITSKLSMLSSSNFSTHSPHRI